MCTSQKKTWFYQSTQYTTKEFDSVLHQMTKKNNTSLTIVCKNERYIDSDVMKKIFDFFHTGKIEFSIEKLEDLMFAAKTFQISELLNGCYEFMKTLTDIEDCLLIEKLAETYSYAELQEKASESARFNFNDICFTDSFLSMEFEQLWRLLKYEDLNVTDESVILESVKRWINHDVSNRKKHSYFLYELIKLPFIPIEKLFEESKSLMKIDDCNRCVLEAIQWQTMNEKKSQLESKRTKRRVQDTVILTVGCWDLDKASLVDMYDSATNKWSTLMNLKTTARNFNYALLNYDLIIIGGFSGDQALNTVTSYNMLTGEKKALAPLLEAKQRPGVGVIGGIIYIAGGSDMKNVLKTAEKYDPTANKWISVQSMPTARAEVGCVVFNNELYIIGGNTGSASTDVNEAYCPSTDQWRKCSPMSTKRYSPGVAKIGKFIYAVGGRIAETNVNIQSAERYDPNSDVWASIESLDTPRYGLGLAAMGNNLIAVGGGQGGATMTIVEEYDSSTNKWRKLAPCTSRAHVNLLAVSKIWIDRVLSNGKLKNV